MEINIEQRNGWDIKSGNTVKVWQKIGRKALTRLLKETDYRP